VLYVPELKKNFLSVSVLEDKGFCHYFLERESTHMFRGS
jgi:hypothetical protein